MLLDARHLRLERGARRRAIAMDQMVHHQQNWLAHHRAGRPGSATLRRMLLAVACPRPARGSPEVSGFQASTDAQPSQSIAGFFGGLPSATQGRAFASSVEPVTHLHKQAFYVTKTPEHTEESVSLADCHETSSDAPPEKEQPSRNHPWTLTHAFYGVMGGFALKTSIGGEERRLALPLSGLRFILEFAPDLLPDLTEDEIWNKCRSDALAKALLMLQLLCFCVSCAARLFQSLPLSLLEVTTVAHALCTVMTCIIW
ncbi:uncharacterized protein PHACADRAFT_255525 [Phanerochaete carnosa HHB-10118-sp]|uniref:Uncharacterized protein n=1 Tax=Phanerochaete carnosa (strain HHB-10118-sp) TaxID=650164 RepID=K5W817_PHACS|nr:uncharacterized protein PHACADRAFT_255525 [Phanerochaete carnosa HHB-10118-sp]EKM55124.1 hypothetical protein PHACADRAFT_255525 [Phanerochaete carnosa HHB-10118-sp]